MAHKYTPRRCSKRWLDDDCPEGVLCIIAHHKKGAPGHWSVFYRAVYGEHPHRSYMLGREMDSNPAHPQGIGLSFDMQPFEVAAYRYRNKHRYATWSSLPEKVKQTIRRDLAEED